MITAIVIIAMLAVILFLGGGVLNYFAKEHNVHYTMMEDIIDENERLKRINSEYVDRVKELERANVMLYMQIRHMTKELEEKE